MDKFRLLSTRDRTLTAIKARRNEGDGVDKRACPLSESGLFRRREFYASPLGKQVCLGFSGLLHYRLVGGAGGAAVPNPKE